MNPVGIMQGRLSPPASDRVQAFPWHTWEQEFAYAHACGINSIEWLFEAEGFDRNPIWIDGGIERIRALVATTGVTVPSVCADYFMAHPFFRVPGAESAASVAVLKQLITQAAALGATTVLLPVLEVAELRTADEKAELLRHLQEPLDLAASFDIRLGLETELPAAEYADLVSDAQHAALGVYFDTGNATARGYDIAADIRILGPLLCGIHVKDRTKGGPTVPLGQGDADFPRFFAAVGEAGYAGPVVMQTAFGRDFLEVATAHLSFVRTLL